MASIYSKYSVNTGFVAAEMRRPLGAESTGSGTRNSIQAPGARPEKPWFRLRFLSTLNHIVA